MSIKLLLEAVNPVDPPQAPDVPTSLVAPTQRAITTRAGETGLAVSADAYAWSSSARRGEPIFIYGTPVQDSQSDETGPSAPEYVSGWNWIHSLESTAVAHYLSYAVGSLGWNGRFINLYA